MDAGRYFARHALITIFAKLAIVNKELMSIRHDCDGDALMFTVIQHGQSATANLIQ